MKKLLLLFCLLASMTSYGQFINGGFISLKKMACPIYTHVSDLPSTHTNGAMYFVTDSVAGVSHGYYVDNGTSYFPAGQAGGGGGGTTPMAIGATVTGSTTGEVLYTDGSGNLNQNAALWWDPTNLALGINRAGTAVADFELGHNFSSGNLKGAVFRDIENTTGALYLDFYKSRGATTEASTGDSLGAIKWSSYNGTAHQVAAAITANLAGTVSTTNMPAAIHFWTNSVATPSVLTDRGNIDQTGAWNIAHAIGGVGGDGNAASSIWDIVATEPNLGYASTLSLGDLSGQAAGNGSRIMFLDEYTGTTFTGGAVIKGYKANSTAGDYSAQLVIQTRLNGNAQADAARFTQNQHTLLGGQAYTADSSGDPANYCGDFHERTGFSSARNDHDDAAKRITDACQWASVVYRSGDEL